MVRLLVVWFSFGLLACTASSGEMSQVRLPLETTTPSGDIYRLAGSIQFTPVPAGPPEVFILDGTESVMTFSFFAPPGTRYTVALLPGWRLERVDGGVPSPVDALLVTPEPIEVTPIEGGAVTVPLAFVVGDDIAVQFGGTSDISVRLDVTELSPPTSLCRSGSHCLHGLSTFEEFDPGTGMTFSRFIPFGLSFEMVSVPPPTMPIHNVMLSAVEMQWDLSRVSPQSDIAVAAENAALVIASESFHGTLEDLGYSYAFSVMMDAPGIVDFRLDAHLPGSLDVDGLPQSEQGVGTGMLHFCGSMQCYDSTPVMTQLEYTAPSI